MKSHALLFLNVLKVTQLIIVKYHVYFIRLQHIKENYGKVIDDKEDIQQLRLAVESAKIQLTTLPVTNIDLNLRSLGKMHYRVTITRL